MIWIMWVDGSCDRRPIPHPTSSHSWEEEEEEESCSGKVDWTAVARSQGPDSGVLYS